MYRNNKEMIDLVSLFNGISTLEGYLMPKPSLLKNSGGTINSTWMGEYKGFIPFPNSKVNVIAPLESELAFYDLVITTQQSHMKWF